MPTNPDVCAELTLRVLRFVQTPIDPPTSPVRWFFMPTLERVGWHEAIDVLAGSNRPVVVAPLLEPGHVAIWHVADMPDKQRQRAEHELANQVSIFDHFVERHGLSAKDSVIFDTTSERFVLCVAELRDWLGDYVVTCGLTFGEGPDAKHPLRLLIIRPPDQQWSMGSVCPVRPRRS